jgi:ABC-type sugar transport system ATPase subunit
VSAALELRDLRVRLGERDVLAGADLSLARGEHVLLVGRSGAGKSTLLRAVAGLVRPDAGTIDLGGERATDGPRLVVPPERRGIGFLFQGGALWPHMTVGGNLRFVLKRAGVPRAELDARVDEALGWVELAAAADRKPGTLSGGEAQRAALARALCARPRLLLLDEPLGPLDAELRAALLDRIAELRTAQGWAALHVTHDPAEARRVADRVLRLEGGRLAPEDAEVRS